MTLSRFSFFLIILSGCALVNAQFADKPATISDGQRDFNTMKTLAGTWQGSVTTDNPAWSTDKPMRLSIRVASHGNALIHELNTGGPEVTVFYVDGDRVALVYYCDLGNRPQMAARPSPDGKTMDFELKDFSGSNEVGHVSRGIFTILDPKHHTEDWTFTLAKGKPVHAHMDFKRVE